jgi:hypothetical protein
MTDPASYAVQLVNPILRAQADQAPRAFSLGGNYPNPFNPTTTITFTLPAASTVTLKVFNILGQEVATLLDAERRNDYRNEVVFNAQSLGSGIYFYRLTAETIPPEGKNARPERFAGVGNMLLIK